MAERTWPALVAEAVGTFLFFFIGAGAIVVTTVAGPGGPGLVGVALAHGLALAVLVSALAAVGSGHFNPAVSFAMWVAGRMAAARAGTFVLAQLAGALAAGLALRAFFSPAAWGPTKIGTPALGSGVAPAAGIAIEAVLTLLLVLVVFGTAVDSRAPQLGGLAIGFAVAADILMGGPLTGAAMNPARWFGPAVASGALDNWYVWWIGPLVGAAAAGLLYRYAFAMPGSTIGLQEEAEGTLNAPEGVGHDEHAHQHDEDAGHHGHNPMAPPQQGNDRA
ncbi:MAG: aquaporin [Chloroflexi bacterium]|nr:MAG: aquaporin [Chloroflexota bacterium]